MTDPTPSPTPLEIAEQGVDESVSRFIGRLHEQIRRTEEERDARAAWAEVDRPVELLRELMERTLAAERTVREQREALERIAHLTFGDLDLVGVDPSDLDLAERASAAMERIAREALASLPPVADERMRP